MTNMTSVKELNKIIRNHLIEQSELNQKNVLNAISNYGETLDKLIENQVFGSYQKTDVVLLFQLNSRDNDADISFTDSDDKIVYYKSYEIYITMYGDNSPNVGNKISARFRTQNVKNSLLDSGIYLEYISNPTIINEFKNKSLWIRTDLSIGIRCKFSITQINSGDNFSVINDIKIINKN